MNEEPVDELQEKGSKLDHRSFHGLEKVFIVTAQQVDIVQVDDGPIKLPKEGI